MNDLVNPFSRKYMYAVVITVLTALLLIIVSLIMGKNEFFLWINADLGSFLDYFFKVWTNIGDGIIWVIAVILFFKYHKKKLPLLLSTLIFSTLLTQVTKHFIFPHTLRPTAAIANQQLIHTVSGVELATQHSFPSGHTATAFSFFLLASLLINNRWVVPIGFVCALLVGYSRVYLAQHFPIDVGGGMIAAVFAVYFSLGIQKKWEQRNA